MHDLFLALSTAINFATMSSAESEQKRPHEEDNNGAEAGNGDGGDAKKPKVRTGIGTIN